MGEQERKRAKKEEILGANNCFQEPERRRRTVMPFVVVYKLL
jgi:hypothetical protein